MIDVGFTLIIIIILILGFIILERTKIKDERIAESKVEKRINNKENKDKLKGRQVIFMKNECEELVFFQLGNKKIRKKCKEVPVVIRINNKKGKIISLAKKNEDFHELYYYKILCTRLNNEFEIYSMLFKWNRKSLYEDLMKKEEAKKWSYKNPALHVVCYKTKNDKLTFLFFNDKEPFELIRKLSASEIPRKYVFSLFPKL
jgi:hypothetical protein